MKNNVLLAGSLSLLIVTLFSCNNATTPSTEALAAKQDSTPTRRDEQAVMAILYQQKAAEYRALCFQAYNIATQRVAYALSHPHKKPLAVITDLDETALDNSAIAALEYLHDSATFPRLTSWWLQGIADSVPGSVSFFKYCAKNKVDIYYISNRDASAPVISATRRNMDSLGFPQCEEKDTSHFLFKTNKSSKQDRRDTVQKYRDVIVYLGDNLADHDAAFDNPTKDSRRTAVDKLTSVWGSKYIVFPNADYGDWENVLYNGFLSATQRQKDSMRRLALDTMKIHGHW